MSDVSHEHWIANSCHDKSRNQNNVKDFHYLKDSSAKSQVCGILQGRESNETLQNLNVCNCAANYSIKNSRKPREILPWTNLQHCVLSFRHDTWYFDVVLCPMGRKPYDNGNLVWYFFRDAADGGLKNVLVSSFFSF